MINLSMPVSFTAAVCMWKDIIDFMRGNLGGSQSLEKRLAHEVNRLTSIMFLQHLPCQRPALAINCFAQLALFN